MAGKRGPGGRIQGPGTSITGVTEVWHAVLTGGDQPNCGNESHILECIQAHNDALSRNATLFTKDGKNPLGCQEATCTANAAHGAHVYTINEDPNGHPNLCYLLATCRRHNTNPKMNTANYPVEADYNMWKKGQGTGPGFNGITRTFPQDYYGHNTIKARASRKVFGRNVLVDATTIKDIKDGMAVKPGAILKGHLINVVIPATFANSYDFP